MKRFLTLCILSAGILTTASGLTSCRAGVKLIAKSIGKSAVKAGSRAAVRSYTRNKQENKNSQYTPLSNNNNANSYSGNSGYYY